MDCIAMMPVALAMQGYNCFNKISAQKMEQVKNS